MWKHTTSIAWMRERNKHLTSTDIKGLLPFTKTGRPRKVTKDDYRKLFLDKQRVVQESDLVSTGWAARGHLLEPIAIKRFNEAQQQGALSSFFGEYVPPMYHWDDTLIHRAGRYSIAFSPDGMNIAQDQMFQEPALCFDTAGLEIASALVEVKSYSGPTFYDAINTPLHDLEERWQIATGLLVMSRVDRAYLVFFNPSIAQQLCVRCFKRGDLIEEMDEIVHINNTWNEVVNEMIDTPEKISKETDCFVGVFEPDEYEIYTECEKARQFDPPKPI